MWDYDPGRLNGISHVETLICDKGFFSSSFLLCGNIFRETFKWEMSSKNVTILLENKVKNSFVISTRTFSSMSLGWMVKRLRVRVKIWNNQMYNNRCFEISKFWKLKERKMSYSIFTFSSHTEYLKRESIVLFSNLFLIFIFVRIIRIFKIYDKL